MCAQSHPPLNHPNVPSSRAVLKLLTKCTASYAHPHFQILLELLNAGASVTATNERGMTAFLEAADSGGFELMRLLQAHSEMRLDEIRSDAQLSFDTLQGP